LNAATWLGQAFRSASSVAQGKAHGTGAVTLGHGGQRVSIAANNTFAMEHDTRRRETGTRD